jgi:hypothetical protein
MPPRPDVIFRRRFADGCHDPGKEETPPMNFPRKSGYSATHPLPHDQVLC